MAARWSTNHQYSYGFLVPCFALVLLWFRRPLLAGAALAPCWWGLSFLGAGLFFRFVAASSNLRVIDAYSLFPTLAGLVLLLGGWSYLKWSWPAIAFLGFMMPLPFQIEIALAYPLRRLATLGSTYLLQILGYPALAVGNVINIDQFELGIIEACSGLGMLMTFFALATAMALVVPAKFWDRMVLVISAIPIALGANVVRITATAIAYQSLGDDPARIILHDLAGWFMMPLALGLLWLELWLLKRLFLPANDPRPAPLTLAGQIPGLLPVVVKRN